MKYTRNILTIAFAAILLLGSAAVSASAQRRGGGRVIVRPVVVRPYYGFRHRFWNSWYDPFYGDPYFYDPYLRAREQQNYLQGDLNGNRKELRKHLEKYNADGVITAKEQKELNDDYRDVEKAERRLREFENGA
jgi:hypothetical protein